MGEIPSVHAFEDVRMVGNTVCANGLKSRDGIVDPENDVIRKDMLFSSMEDTKVWLQKYSVRHHCSFVVQHFDVKEMSDSSVNFYTKMLRKRKWLAEKAKPYLDCSMKNASVPSEFPRP